LQKHHLSSAQPRTHHLSVPTAQNTIHRHASPRNTICPPRAQISPAKGKTSPQGTRPSLSLSLSVFRSLSISLSSLSAPFLFLSSLSLPFLSPLSVSSLSLSLSVSLS